jgi:formylglycine-generating enzyme required for sulfatase activity
VQELSQKKGKRQTPRIIADPIEKSHLILMPKYATLSDISFLKNYAARAERKQEWQKAKSLWRIVLNAAQGADEDAIEALSNIGVEERLGRIDENLSVIKSDVTEVNSFNLPEDENQEDDNQQIIFVESEGVIKSRKERIENELKCKNNEYNQLVNRIDTLITNIYDAVDAETKNTYERRKKIYEERKSLIDEEIRKLEKDLASIYKRLQLLYSSPERQKVYKLSFSSKELDKEELFTFEVVRVNAFGSIANRRQESARQKVEDLGNGIKLEMVKIPGGTFTMGSPKSEEGNQTYERPQHDVTVSHFFMSKYSVTQGQWRAIASRTDLKVELGLKLEPSSHFKEQYKGIDRWNRAVNGVNWYEAVEFCKRLSKLKGRNYRLPSEAEWEYACRAGTTTPFHFGETINTKLANYRGTDHEKYNWSGSYGKGPKGVYRGGLTPVGYFKVANAFGLYDMHGNVWEWCADEWHDNYTGAPTDGSVWLNGEKNLSPLRGGSWANFPHYCRSAIRNCFNWRDDRSDITGFRVVCDGGRTL